LDDPQSHKINEKTILILFKMFNLKNSIIKLFFILISSILGIIMCEVALRVKHNFYYNYDIEMWKYAKQLKQKNVNSKIGHTHIKNKSKILQGVEVKINNYGQRDIDITKNTIQKHDRSFLILGSSIALGWGVKQENTFSNLLNKMSKQSKKNWIFVNGGVGNYNTERYVNNYLKNWAELNFTDIIVHFFVNDTELIKESKTNFFTRNTHIGVISWKLFNSYKSSFKKDNLKNYYEEKYQDNYEGYKKTVIELKKLKQHCKENNINCHIVLMPDIHQLKPYKLNFINKKISSLSKNLDFSFLDLFTTFSNVEENKVWNKYQDPHPNNIGHNLIANEIYMYLTK